ncbi:MAG: Electron transport complex subunit RsxB [Candidatus Argoarchaeum ethanivorans]|uniref:Electron transport complex subunit RsxB n=1 Tax=Candidatus Argoarchaeum ethanivorans TaxID=2608793 RepID=A0A811T3S1_9EURY|nr:MAG: Electron transport complex subunit RsxB [Candidatus Argoarchaeum ethanivorans]
MVQIGIFLCSCSDTINLSLKQLKKDLKKLDGVRVVEIHDLLCQKDGLNHIIYDVRNFKLDRILIAGCEKKRAIFNNLAEQLGLPQPLIVNTKEWCGYVHEQKEGTEKAKGLIHLALTQEFWNVKTIKQPVEKSVILIGGDRASRLASALSKLAHVTLITKQIQDVRAEFDILIGTPLNIYGSIGAFEVEFEPNQIDYNRCIDCKRCIEVCEDDAIIDGSIIYINDRCTACGKCVDACPVHAIDLKPHPMRLSAGQVIVDDENFSMKLGIHQIDGRDPLSLITDVISLFDGIKKPRYLNYDLSSCASSVYGLSGCSLCFCPYGAIKRDADGKITIDEISCEGCGLCATLCPLSLIELDAFSNKRILPSIDTLLIASSKLKRRIILFTDIKEGKYLLDEVGRLRLSYPPVLPVLLPSIKSLSKEHILRAFDAGADGVVILGHTESSLELDLIRACLRQLGMDNRLITIEQLDPDTFTSAVKIFAGRLEPSMIRKYEPVKLEDMSNRAVFLALIESLSVKTSKLPDVKIPSKEFGFVTVGSTCTICDACTGVCPTKSILKDENKIIFNHGMCINCELCKEVCPEHAIEVVGMLDTARLLSNEKLVLASSNLMYCARCGKAYMTEASYERITSKLSEKGLDSITLSYCERCRPVVTLEQMIEVKNE